MLRVTSHPRLIGLRRQYPD